MEKLACKSIQGVSYLATAVIQSKLVVTGERAERACSNAYSLSLSHAESPHHVRHSQLFSYLYLASKVDFRALKRVNILSTKLCQMGVDELFNKSTRAVAKTGTPGGHPAKNGYPIITTK